MDQILLGVFLVALFCFGGASRTDTIAQTVIRLIAVLMLGYSAVRLSGDHWRRARPPILFLLACAALIALQLVPLPYQLWSALPGHAQLAQMLQQGGSAPQWRPLSLTPDLTLNSLLALLPALAAAAGLALISRHGLGFLLPALLVAVAITSVIGIVQVSTHSLYFFDVTNFGASVGVFANRNHQAVFLALSIPLLAAWVALPIQDGSYRGLRNWVALCFGAAIFPMLLMTGSRGGLLLGAGGLVGGLVLLRGEGRLSLRGDRWLSAILKLIPLLMGVAATVAMVLWSRGEAFDRLVSSGSDEGRIENLPLVLRIVGDFFPTGSGFGSFDPVFRMYEPYEVLDASYLNHAHNDLAEIMLEGGVFALVLLAIFLIWLSRASWGVWRDPARSQARTLGRVGSIFILMLFGASLADYPLRTPIMAGLLMIAVSWLIAARSSREAPPRSERWGKEALGFSRLGGAVSRRARSRQGSDASWYVA